MSTPSASDPLLAFQSLFTFLEPYKPAVFILALYALVGRGPFPLRESWWPELWSPNVFFVGLVFLAFFISTVRFSGPLRFGYIEYSPLISTFIQGIPNWSPFSVLAIFFFPSWFLVLCTLPVVWLYVLQKYREIVRDVREKVEHAKSRATVAVNAAREYARNAAEYEKQALEVVAVTRRDAMLAQSVKITDFFDQAVESWAALGRITAPAQDATAAARVVEDDARTVTESEPPDDQGRAGDLAEILLEKATIAVESALESENKAKMAQATIAESRTAQQQVATARRQALTNAENAVKAVRALTNSISETSAMLFVASDRAEEVRKLADRAMAAAIEGDKKTALSLAAAAGSVADEVVKAKERLSSAKDSAHKFLLDLLLGN